MQRIVRAVPVSSPEAIEELGRAIDAWPVEQRRPWLGGFGNAVEEWYFQEIAGQPHLIAVVEGDDLSTGYDRQATLDDPFFNWFRKQVMAISGVDIREVPTAASSEHLYTLSLPTEAADQ